MAKTYWLKFGSGDPRTNSGLSPTFLTFELSTGTTAAPPGVTEAIVGSGLYSFSYTQNATYSVAFLVDGATTGLANSDRYITGVLDPVQAVDQNLGWSADSIGSTSASPSSLYGMANRLREFNEGNATFNKTTGVWDIYSRGSTTLLIEKTLTQTSSTATKA